MNHDSSWHDSFRMMALLATLLSLLSLQPDNGTGCQKLMNQVCPDWKSSVPRCVECVKKNIDRLSVFTLTLQPHYEKSKNDGRTCNVFTTKFLT